jgi:hypothetical protein
LRKKSKTASPPNGDPTTLGRNAQIQIVAYSTMAGRLQFKLRVEVLMLEIKDRNHTGRQGAYFADNAARASFLKHTALLGLRWGKLPAEEEQKKILKDIGTN